MATIWLAPDRFDALASRVLTSGGRVTAPLTLSCDMGGRCEKPVFSTFVRGRDTKPDILRGRKIVWSKGRDPQHPDGTHGKLVYTTWGANLKQRHRYIDLYLPCRRCPACARRKAYLWASRAEKEVAAAFRTWMGTFTVRPADRVRIRILASRKYGDETFSSLHKILSAEFTLMLKRIRKNTGQRLRYILVAEAHKDGFPHYHMLIHEHGEAVPRRELETEWRLGFTAFRLADSNAAKYVAKYVSKDARARVRASIRYGSVNDETLRNVSRVAHSLGNKAIWPVIGGEGGKPP